MFSAFLIWLLKILIIVAVGGAVVALIAVFWFKEEKEDDRQMSFTDIDPEFLIQYRDEDYEEATICGMSIPVYILMQQTMINNISMMNHSRF